MEMFEVRRFDLEARDELHLGERLSTFRHAVRARNGAIIDVRWAPRTLQDRCRALVTYELPVPTGALAAQDEPDEGAP